jgi:hypothetical protein
MRTNCNASSLGSQRTSLIMKRLGMAFASVGCVLTPVNAWAAPAGGDLCAPAPPTLSAALKLSDRAVLYVVTTVIVDADPSPDDDTEVVRGTFELSPLGTLKGGGVAEQASARFDATLYRDLFGASPCRWSALPAKGEIWVATGSRDGENCAECDGRLDAHHKLNWRGPLSSFLR